MSLKSIAVFLCAAAVLLGQSITSGLVGTIHDNSGAVVPNATIAARNIATNTRASTKSDASGKYVLLQLAPGAYEVEIEAQGFKKYVQSGVILELQQQALLDATLSVGQLTEEVT